MSTANAAAPKDGMPSMIAYLTRVLKTPTIGASWEELAAQARARCCRVRCGLPPARIRCLGGWWPLARLNG